MDLQRTDEGVLAWLQHGVIPKNRTFVEEILKTLGLSVGNTKGIIDVCKGLSLNDSFWVVPKGFTGTFAEYNLYENDFSEILSFVAYTGIGQTNRAFTTSPELTTNGTPPSTGRRNGWRQLKGIRRSVCGSSWGLVSKIGLIAMLTEERYQKLAYKYEDEQSALKQNIKHLKEIVAEEKTRERNADGFLALVKNIPMLSI